MRRGIAANRLGVQVAEMRQVHQIVDHQHVIGLDRIDVVLVGPFAGFVVVGKIDDPVGIGPGCVAHPYPYQLVFFDCGIAAHLRVCRYLLLPGDAHAAARSVDDEAVIAALDSLLDDGAHAKRRSAVAAAGGERPDAARTVAKQPDGLVKDSPRQRLFAADLVRPGADVPRITQQHEKPPLCWPDWATSLDGLDRHSALSRASSATRATLSGTLRGLRRTPDRPAPEHRSPRSLRPGSRRAYLPRRRL